jgi:hypothetical protein
MNQEYFTKTEASAEHRLCYFIEIAGRALSELGRSIKLETPVKASRNENIK